MKLDVESASLHALRAPVSDDIAMSFGRMRYRTSLLIELQSRDGFVGFGESWVNHPEWAVFERIATLDTGVLPMMRGAAVSDVASEQARLLTALEPLGRQWGAPGPIWQAISGIDIALWDLWCTSLGRSISDVIGVRMRHEVPAYASGLGPRNVASQAESCRELGFSQVKLRVGFGAQVDEENLVAIQQVIGDDGILFVDPNQAWSLDEALRMAPVLNKYKVAWVEEPVRGNRLADLRIFAEETGLRIATGENIYGLNDLRPYIESDAVSVLQPDVSKTGGITEVMAICQAATEHGKEVVPHLYGGPITLAATLQLAACCPSISSIEYDFRENALRDPLLVSPPAQRSGLIAIPDGPGLGVRLNRHAIERVEMDWRPVSRTITTGGTSPQRHLDGSSPDRFAQAASNQEPDEEAGFRKLNAAATDVL